LNNVRKYRRYGEVPFKYNGTIVDSEEISEEISSIPRISEEPSEITDNITSGSESDHDAEDWERHEALHPVEHEEYKYEEEVDKKWEKGGSGLGLYLSYITINDIKVFYTDALYWEEGTRDEEDEVEDLWIDEEEHKQPVVMERKKKRKIQESCKRTEENSSVGEFEKFNKGVAGKIMRNAGWANGKGLGIKEQGIAAPIHLPSQFNKKGLGYEKVKNDRFDLKKEEMAPLIRIATIFDNVETFPDKLRKDFVRDKKNNVHWNPY
jgi:hypothetical protein